MKASITGMRVLYIAILLLAATQAAGAQSIYKCTKAGQLEYTDRPCSSGKGELIHQASDSEIIEQYLDLGQDALAKRYADSHHLEALYKELLEARQEKMEAKAQQQADEAKQRDEDARQQELLDAAANRGRLQGENDALRRQNDQYRDQLAQPVYGEAPAYWGTVPPYWNRDRDREHDHDHDHDHDSHPPSSKPVFHPCTQLAGGRVQC
jgi:Small-conductance mechanosensitive channel